MIVTYKYITVDYIKELRIICETLNFSSQFSDWICSSVENKEKYVAVVGEFIDDVLNGVSIGSSSSKWLRYKQEVAPSWILVRTERILSPTAGSAVYLKKMLILLASHFEKLGYFHVYFIRPLPKKDYTITRLVRMLSRILVMPPYTLFFETYIRTDAELLAAPLLFQSLIKKGVNVSEHPYVVVSAFLPNEWHGIVRHPKLIDNIQVVINITEEHP